MADKDRYRNKDTGAWGTEDGAGGKTEEQRVMGMK
jgi:hypothetical protein